MLLAAGQNDRDPARGGLRIPLGLIVLSLVLLVVPRSEAACRRHVLANTGADNGVDTAGCVEAPDSAIFRQNGHIELTLELWASVDDFEDFAGLVGNVHYSANRSGYGIHTYSSDPMYGNELLFAALTSSQGYVRTGNLFDFVDGDWFHVAMTYKSKDDELQIYINGFFIGLANIPYRAAFWPSNLFRIACNKDDDEAIGTAGRFAEVRLWDHVRTQQEIADNLHASLTGSEAGLDVYYPLDQSSGTSASELVGSLDASFSDPGSALSWEAVPLPQVVASPASVPVNITPGQTMLLPGNFSWCNVPDLMSVWTSTNTSAVVISAATWINEYSVQVTAPGGITGEVVLSLEDNVGPLAGNVTLTLLQGATCDPECTGNSFCQASGGGGDASCTCLDGWAGTQCDQPECSSGCELHAECTGPNVCTCQVGYTNPPSCNTPVCDNCALPYGSCTAPGVCECQQGWSGSSCILPVCANCTTGIDQALCLAPDVCSCLPGWTPEWGQPDACSTAICSPPCRNNTACVAPDTCECLAGWTGHPDDGCLVLQTMEKPLLSLVEIALLCSSAVVAIVGASLLYRHHKKADEAQRIEALEEKLADTTMQMETSRRNSMTRIGGKEKIISTIDPDSFAKMVFADLLSPVVAAPPIAAGKLAGMLWASKAKDSPLDQLIATHLEREQRRALARALLFLAHVSGPSAVATLMRAVLHRDVVDAGQSKDRLRMLMRTDTLSSQLVDVVHSMYGANFLLRVLGATLDDFVQSDSSFDMDPDNVHEDDVQLHKYTLMMAAEKLITIIRRSLPRTPVPIRLMYGILADEINEACGVLNCTEDETRSLVRANVGSAVFLRFFIPAITVPEKFQLVDAVPGDTPRRLLLTVGKMLNKLSNGLHFSSEHEKFMAPLNEFVDVNDAKMVKFLQEMPSSELAPRKWSRDPIPDNVRVHAQIQVAEIVIHHQADLLARMRYEEKHAAVKKIEALLQALTDEVAAHRPNDLRPLPRVSSDSRGGRPRSESNRKRTGSVGRSFNRRSSFSRPRVSRATASSKESSPASSPKRKPFIDTPPTSSTGSPSAVADDAALPVAASRTSSSSNQITPDASQHSP